MTEKELSRLRKPHLLELLFRQGKEAAALQAQLEKVSGSLEEAKNVMERLKNKLNEKDGQIEKLKDRLNEKDTLLGGQQEEMEALKDCLNERDALLDRQQEEMEALKGRLNEKDALLRRQQEEMEVWREKRKMELKELDFIAEASLKLADVFETAQRDAGGYLDRLRQACEKRTADRLKTGKGSMTLESASLEDWE